VTSATRFAEARASAIQLGTTASVPNGSMRNWARPITVMNWPTVIRPVSANQPAMMAMPQASSVLSTVEAAR
jgi:hypothetical protein